MYVFSLDSALSLSMVTSMLKIISALLFTLLMIPTLSAEDAPYRHVVLFKFKDDAKAEQITTIENHFVSLKDKIDLVVDLEWGTNVSPEGLDQGLTHCFFVTFKNKADLEKYIPHPDHKAFVEKLKPILDKVVVVDYVAK